MRGAGPWWTDAPASGAWRPGDPVGDRRWAALEPAMRTEFGVDLGPVTVAYETWGRPAPGLTNAVLVEHALTGDSHLAGPTGPGHRAPGWWGPLVGPGAPLDPDRWFLVCPNVLGGCQGTTGPSSAAPDGRRWGPRFPTITVRDQVAAEAALADHLGVGRWAAVIGGSMGGMRVLEWAVGHPDRLERAVVVACGAAATAEQIALCAAQAEAIRSDPGWMGGDYYDAALGRGPARGLGLARTIGHVSYRTEVELDARFGRSVQAGEDPAAGGRFAVESYLDHHAAKLAGRFDANSYLVLSRAMDLHDVGRDRGGVAAALAGVQARVTVAGVDTDRLYPLRLQTAMAAALPGGAPPTVVVSAAGHDGFLTETAQVGGLIATALDS